MCDTTTPLPRGTRVRSPYYMWEGWEGTIASRSYGTEPCSMHPGQQTIWYNIEWVDSEGRNRRKSLDPTRFQIISMPG